MLKKSIFGMLLIVTLLAACGRAPTQLLENGIPGAEPSLGPISNADSLISALSTLGYTVQKSGDIEQPFFTVQAKVLMLNQSEIQVFEYADTPAMQVEADLVDPEGSSIGTTMVSWIGTPHFFSAGRLIIIYIGDDASLIGDLQEILGPQFAGR